MPLGALIIDEMFDLPSKVDSPIVSQALLIAQDCKRLFFPKSIDSRIVLLFGFVMSMIPIFSFPHPTIRIGLEKSLQNTLLPMSMVKAGAGFPGCQK